MKFRSPDEAVRAMHRANDRATNPGRSVIAGGKNPARSCADPRCKRRRASLRMKARHDPSVRVPPAWTPDNSKDAGGMIDRCSHCKAIRPHADAYVLPGHVSSSGRGRPPAALERVGDFGPLSRLLDEMERARDRGELYREIFIAYATSQLPADQVALQASRVALGGRAHWSGDDVHRMVRWARSWMARRLQSMGWLQSKARQIEGGTSCRVGYST